MWSLVVQLHSSLQLNSETWNFWCQELEEKENNASVLHPLKDWHWGCPQPCPMSSPQSQVEDIAQCGFQQCLWCSLLSILGMFFLSNGHKVSEPNPLVPGQADVNVSGVTQRRKILCWRAWRGPSIWQKRIDNYVLHILTAKTCGQHWPSQHLVSQRCNSSGKLCINWECSVKYYV